MAIIRGSPRPNIAVASSKTNVLVGLAVAQVAVAQAHMNMCYVGGVKLKDFKPLVWNRCVQRFVDTTLTICLFDPPQSHLDTWTKPSLPGAAHELPSRPPKQEASTSGGASSGGRSSSAMVVEDDELNEQVYEDHVLRWGEEAAGREVLDDADWVEEMPWHDDLWAQHIQLDSVAQEYMTTFNHSVTRDWDMEKMPLNPRLWVVEANWCLKALQRRGHLPRCMTQPHDKYIRADASKSADGFTDPGNEILDVYVNVLRLWQYADLAKVQQTMRVAIGEYGTRSNQSSHGPVNLRGNIVEAMFFGLQQKAHSHVGKPSGSKGHGRGSGR